MLSFLITHHRLELVLTVKNKCITQVTKTMKVGLAYQCYIASITFTPITFRWVPEADCLRLL